jgi:hypothetical protein
MRVGAAAFAWPDPRELLSEGCRMRGNPVPEERCDRGEASMLLKTCQAQATGMMSTALDNLGL